MIQEKTVGRRKNMETASPARYTPVNRHAYKKLRKKQEVFFDKKFYIGDISVDDDEYAELINYLRKQIRNVPLSTPVSNDPLLCIALVQIGIRKYNGNYWGNVGNELGVKISAQAQSFLGWSFILTLQRHEKFILNENERVNSILFHTFVSDYYSNGLFELLFQYYRRDLERDINRNTREQMQALIDTLDRTSKMNEEAGEALAARLSGKTGNEKGSQSYKLRHHTLDAISANPRHSKLRLHRIIRLIDKAFWNDSVPANPAARLTKRFIDKPSDFSGRKGLQSAKRDKAQNKHTAEASRTPCAA